MLRASVAALPAARLDEPVVRVARGFQLTQVAVVAAGLLSYILIQLLTYPQTIGIKDESTYLSSAYVLKAGTIFADVAHVPVWGGILRGGHVVAMYPPGEAAILLPVVLVDWHLVFALSMLSQIAGFLLFLELLRRFNVRQVWGLLYLFFPALVLFSRTVMTEVPSATLLLLALILYFRQGRWRIAAGVLLGVLTMIAYKNLIPVAFLLLGAAIHDGVSPEGRQARVHLADWRQLNTVNLLAGFLPLTLLVVGYNLSIYGHVVGYGTNGFALGFVLPNFVFYALDLVILFPLMLLAPLFYRGAWRLELRLLTYGVLAVTCAYYYIDNAHGFAENLLTGARLLLPVMPVWLLTYASVLDRLLAARRLLVPGITAVSLAGLMMCLVVSIAHERHLTEAAAVRDLIYRETASADQLLINDETAKFISPAWGPRTYQFLRRPGQARPNPAVSPVAVVYTTQGKNDAGDLPLAQRTASDLGAGVRIDRWIGAWRVVIWKG